MSTQTCKYCGCTNIDCTQCIQRTGEPCYWAKKDICSACYDNKLIVDFLGLKTNTHYEMTLMNEMDEQEYGFDATEMGIHFLPFRDKWDWQIPVWNRLYKIFDSISRDQKTEKLRNDVMNFADAYAIRMHQGEKRECFKILVEAIKLYNKKIKAKKK